MTKFKKIITALCIIIPIILCGIFAGVSYLYYGRSIMATLSEISLNIKDADKAFETEEGFTDFVITQKNKQSENMPYEIPKGLRLKATAEYKDKHGMQVYYLDKEKLSTDDTVIFYLHGSAFISDITKAQWKFADFLADRSGHPVIVPLYPKLPEYTCEDASEALLALYKETAKKKNIEHIYFVGDSSGGNLALSLAKQLREADIKQPEKLILISPWLDLTMNNKDILPIEKDDPVLGLYGLKALGKMWADKRAVTNPTVSPIYGSNEALGEIILFASTRDILYPDILKYSERLKNQKIEHQFITASGLNHNYIFTFTPEAREAKAKIAEEII